MDLDNINCPQYVHFGSDSFDEHNGSVSDAMYISSKQNSLEEGDLCEADTSEITDSIISSDEPFVVHAHATRSHANKQKKKATIPKPFHFETDNRLKDKNSQAAANPDEKDFTSQLRQHNAPRHTASGVTKVKPFNLTEPKKRKREEGYMPLAEQVEAFVRKTPDRYHTSQHKEFQPQEHWSPKKLRPRTPNLHAVKRHRTVEALSREEQEAKELEEMKAYEFHAQPIDPRVYKPEYIEKPESKQTTKSKSIELKTAHRPDTRLNRKTSEKARKFRARPVPKNILAGPTGLGEKPKILITKPKSPSFTSGKRIEKRKIMEQLHDTARSPAKKPKIVKSKPIVTSPLKIKRTEVQPFSFDKVDQVRYAQKAKKIQEEIEKENKPYVFRAQLLPSPAPSSLPNVEKKPATHPQPFNFCLDNRSFKQSFITHEETSVSFKAQPATVLHKEPFIPEKLPKLNIETQEFDLKTDRRASERLKQKEEKDVKELEKEQILLAQMAVEEEKERERIQKMRQEMVHKANPVRQFKQVEVKPSSKPLTKPVSPKFETDKRLQIK